MQQDLNAILTSVRKEKTEVSTSYSKVLIYVFCNCIVLIISHIKGIMNQQKNVQPCATKSPVQQYYFLSRPRSTFTVHAPDRLISNKYHISASASDNSKIEVTVIDSGARSQKIQRQAVYKSGRNKKQVEYIA